MVSPDVDVLQVCINTGRGGRRFKTVSGPDTLRFLTKNVGRYYDIS